MNIRANLDSIPQAREVTSIGKVGSAVPVSAQGDLSAGFDRDEAHLSSASSLVRQALALPEVRNEKVAAIQQALEQGRYQVSAPDVAGKLMDHMLGK